MQYGGSNLIPKLPQFSEPMTPLRMSGQGMMYLVRQIASLSWSRGPIALKRYPSYLIAKSFRKGLISIQLITQTFPASIMSALDGELQSKSLTPQTKRDILR
jgi:hypothetical protein